MKIRAKEILAGLVWMSVALAVHAESMLEVEATQRYPWNGMVHLQCHVPNPYGAKVQAFTVTDAANDTNFVARTLLTPSGDLVEEGYFLPSGDSVIVWNAAADLPKGWQSDRLAVTGSIKNHQRISFAEIGQQTTINQVTLSATASSGGTVSFSVASGPGRISGNTLTFTGAGTVSVLATQAGNADWCSASTTQTVVVHAAYVVIDMSGGSSASSYPVTYLNSAPSGGFNTAAYKTTKLVLKCCLPGTYKMQKVQNVTLTKAFYMGLFEVTQKQWILVTGANTSGLFSYGAGDTYPVYYFRYSDIRGNSNGAKWPSSAAVDSSSFLGKLQARTGMKFDLPTEAQWEYACRAGTTTTYSYGDSENGNYMWYSGNAGIRTHPVGGKLANPWGFYDMHGNVTEWCLDWSGTLTYGTDPKGASSGTSRIARGGNFGDRAANNTSSARRALAPTHNDGNLGFRLSLPAK